MSNQVRVRLVLFLAAYAGMISLTGLWAQDVAPKQPAATATDRTVATIVPAPSVKAKPLNESVKKALAYLASQQHANGGWSQGEESTQMGNSSDKLKDIPNIGDTCMAA